MFHSAGIWGLQDQESCSKGEWEKIGYIEVLRQRAGSLHVKIVLSIKENQLS